MASKKPSAPAQVIPIDQQRQKPTRRPAGEQDEALVADPEGALMHAKMPASGSGDQDADPEEGDGRVETPDQEAS